MLDRLYLELDELADSLGVYKIEIIGDAYLCATNISADQVSRCGEFLLVILLTTYK